MIYYFQLVFSFVKAHWLIPLIVFLYFVLVINKIVFEIKIFRLDLIKLEQKGRSEVAVMKTKMIRDGTARYATAIADGIVKATQDNADEDILRRKLKFRHDLINSLFSPITQFFGK